MLTTTLLLLSLSDAPQPTAPPALPPVVQAAPLAEPPRFAIRANAIVQGFDFEGVGLEVSGTFNRRFALEGAVEALAIPGGSAGWYTQVLGRFGYFGRAHGMSLGIGPGLLDSNGFGRVVFAVPELAYEYRPLGGLSLALGLGAPVVLNDSLEVPCPDSGWFSCFLETTQFRAGDIAPRLRVALGYSF